MDTAIILFIFTKIGLILNIVGTLMLAFSFGKSRADAHQGEIKGYSPTTLGATRARYIPMDDKGRKIYLASFRHPRLFYWGLALIILGFILQLVI